MPKVIVTADLHGQLPEIPPCDVLIIAGDVCPDHPVGKKARYDLSDKGAKHQYTWLDTSFRFWLRRVTAKHIIGIAGNHDFVFEDMPTEVGMLGLPWTYLQDEEVTVEGLRIFGSPWVTGHDRWAFSPSSDNKLRAMMAKIPSGLDILAIHGPPYGIADFVGPRFGGPLHVGNPHLNPALDRVRPKVVVTGHIHECYGSYRLPYGGTLYSVSLNNDDYEAVQPPVDISHEFE